MNAYVLNKLKNTKEMIPDEHDGSYELMRAIVNGYRGVDETLLDYLDLNAVYLMAIGTWKHGVPVKKKTIESSHLSQASKLALIELLNKIHSNSKEGKYENHETADPGVFGMFGTGFYSFQNKTDKKSVSSFIKMCVDISDMTVDIQMFARAEQVLNNHFKGMKAASASVVLHCLKPNTFPILNNNMGNESIFEALEIPLTRKGDIDTYIQNCRSIKTFRDVNLPIKNYRIFDMAAWELGKEKNPVVEIIKQYKDDFVNRDKEERYKWEAIQCFQNNWNIDAENFAEMLERALAKTYNLLTSQSTFAKAMIIYLAAKDRTAVRDMFVDLYNENTNVAERIEAFISRAVDLFEKTKDSANEKMKQHFQSQKAVGIYLFLRYPEKYFIYQYEKYKGFAARIGYDVQVKTGYVQNIPEYFEMCEMVLAEVRKDTDLQVLSKGRLDSKCYQDPEFHMLTDDIVYYGNKFNNQTPKGTDDPDEETEDEKEVNIEMATFSKNMILYGPPGTGKTYQTINYAVAIIEDKVLADILAEDYVAVLARYNVYKEAGSIEFTTFHQSFGYEEFIEGIKPFLYSDDEEQDITNIAYKIEDGIFKAFCDKAGTPIIKKTNDFGFSEYPTLWKVSLAGTGDNPVRQDCMKNDYIRIGWDEYGQSITDETVFSVGGKTVLNAFINRMQKGDIILSCFSERAIDAIGVVEGEYEWHQEMRDYCRVRKVKWLVKNINYDIVEMNRNMVMTLSTVYKMSVSVADVIKILNVNSAGTIISAEVPKKFVFIIDEINRGNISKILGELITLIEPAKRLGQSEAMTAKLPYSKKLFGVPDNVYIIGTMNTADRSIALIDTALRRRFTFIEHKPDIRVLSGVEVEGVSIPDMMSKINRRIEVLGDREHTIGHAYFVDLKDTPTLEMLSNIFAHHIIPLLQEYFYEDYEKIRLVLGDSHKDPEEQFVLEKDNDFAELFGGSDFDFDEIPAYEINLAALTNINAYKNI